ncbi:hypothetical protein [Novosphingobium colocasiae]|uniref:hypothetical protein n=1 Tax=Novosphingobium colocasiae TaxID=1256513 RepID=UPI0035AEE7E1
MTLPPFAISVRQPWAWGIIHAGKPLENRIKRAITLGGMDQHRALAIHAAAGMTRDEYEAASTFMASIGVACPRPDELVRGAIIGAVDFAGLTNASDNPWFFGPWALILANPRAVDPIACPGELGAFRWRKGGELRETLPWMKAWPQTARGQRKPAGDSSPTLL